MCGVFSKKPLLLFLYYDRIKSSRKSKSYICLKKLNIHHFNIFGEIKYV